MVSYAASMGSLDKLQLLLGDPISWSSRLLAMMDLSVPGVWWRVTMGQKERLLIYCNLLDLFRLPSQAPYSTVLSVSSLLDLLPARHTHHVTSTLFFVKQPEFTFLYECIIYLSACV